SEASFIPLPTQKPSKENGPYSCRVLRTYPPYKGRRAVYEIEQFYLGLIGSAGYEIYIENQYLTAPSIVDALAQRLTEPSGPDVVIMLPEKHTAPLEQIYMAGPTLQQIKKLRNSDLHDHLTIIYPTTHDDKKTSIRVHSKLMIVDNHYVMLG